MKKIVLNLDINDAKEKQKAMKVVSSLQGIDSIGIDVKEKKMTVVGSVDPVSIVMKLRKSWHTDILTVGPVKEEPKKEEEAIKEEAKEEKQEEEVKKEVPDDQQTAVELVNPYKIYYNPYDTAQYYYVQSAQDNPNSCTIL